jgi:hypothetical protein
VALARFTVYVAPSRGRPGHPLGHGDRDDDGGLLRWRMLAANNRDVARSVASFPDVRGCVEAILRLRECVADGIATATRTGRADWSWRLRLDGEDVAVSSRTYQRRLQCEAASALFIELVPAATLTDIPGQSAPGQSLLVPNRRHRVGAPIVNPEYGTRRG